MVAIYKDERMLVVAPHHDDAEFGLGGWMARAREENVGGFRVLVVAHGDYVRSDGVTVSGSVREQETALSMEILEAEHRNLRWFPENEGLACDYAGLVQAISREIDAYGATEVFVPLPSFNQDHRVVHDACITALRPGTHPTLRNVWCYPYPGSCWGCELPLFGRAYIGLKAHHVALKMRALRQHGSQWRDRPQIPVSPDTCMNQMFTWGRECGVEYAELLFLLREFEPCR